MGAVGVCRVLDYRTTVFGQLLEDDFDVVLDTVGGGGEDGRAVLLHS